VPQQLARASAAARCHARVPPIRLLRAALPVAGLAQHPAEPVGHPPGVRAALAIQHHEQRRPAQPGSMPLQLAVEAPCGTPAGTADFLARLDVSWLACAYATGQRDTERALIRAAARHIGDIALRYRALFRRLGAGLDGPGRLDDADAWYCILEGTAEIAVAEGQARALVDLLAHAAGAGPDGTAQAGGGREILLAVDEFSAVSRRLPIWQLYERARSLGLAVQV